MAMQKKSRKRDAILACVCSTDTHPTAEWVYTQLKPDIPDLSLGTVYRNLAMFRREGIIGSAGVVNGLERYDRNPLPHAHFVCTQCSAVYDLPDIEPPVELMPKGSAVQPWPISWNRRPLFWISTSHWRFHCRTVSGATGSGSRTVLCT